MERILLYESQVLWYKIRGLVFEETVLLCRRGVETNIWFYQRFSRIVFQSCCRIFDASTAESIQDLCRRSLRRLATQEEEDDELVTCFTCVDQG